MGAYGRTSARPAGGPERRPGRPGRPATEVSIGAGGRRARTVPRMARITGDRVQSVQPEVLEGAQGGRGDRRPRSPSEQLDEGRGRCPGWRESPATEFSRSSRRSWTVPGWRGSPATEVSIGASGRRGWKASREAGETGDRGLHRSSWTEVLDGAQGGRASRSIYSPGPSSSSSS